jgi:uncharacterized protein YbjT (DUF2867 family)
MILVTGATGTNGIELIKYLSNLGAPFRAMARKPPETPPRSLASFLADHKQDLLTLIN